MLERSASVPNGFLANTRFESHCPIGVLNALAECGFGCEVRN